MSSDSGAERELSDRLSSLDPSPVTGIASERGPDGRNGPAMFDRASGVSVGATVVRRVLQEAMDAHTSAEASAFSAQVLKAAGMVSAFNNYGQNFGNYGQNFANYGQNFANYAQSVDSTQISRPMRHSISAASKSLPNGSPVPTGVEEILGRLVRGRRTKRAEA